MGDDLYFGNQPVAPPKHSQNSHPQKSNNPGNRILTNHGILVEYFRAKGNIDGVLRHQRKLERES